MCTVNDLDVLTSVAGAVLGPGPHAVVDLLDVVPGVQVDAVRAADDLLPRLAHEESLSNILMLAHASLRPGGVLVAAVPELDRLGVLKPTAPPPKVHGDRVTVQLWDWAPDGLSYGLEVVSLIRGGAGWEISGTAATRHRVLSAAEMEDTLNAVGFTTVQRLAPGESGYRVPVWVAVR
ncbi:hypothetical protein FXN61_44260 [Lentzea sp. PSKA42]|uniref:Methyltransferase domain-containing protein n=1 Tax=Lentzea indica TaxID=2604800 RepID=A0ABX1FWD4_9PSEU|nr:hypothetical protein [Lentzea indica]